MIEAHKKKGNIAAAIWLGSLVVLLGLFFSGYVDGNIWDEGNAIAIVVFVTNMLSFYAALWWLAKAKGYWGVVGVIFAFLHVIGLIILLALPDRKKISSEDATEIRLDDAKPNKQEKSTAKTIYFIRHWRGELSLPVSYCVFQTKSATDSRRKLPPIPAEACH